MKNKKVLYVSPTCDTFGLQMELLATGSAEGIEWGGGYNSPMRPELIETPEFP